MKDNLQSIQSNDSTCVELQLAQAMNHNHYYCEQLQANSIRNTDVGDHALSVSSSEPHQAQR